MTSRKTSGEKSARNDRGCEASLDCIPTAGTVCSSFCCERVSK